MQRQHSDNPTVDYGTRARVVVGAEATYVCVTETNPHASADYKLPGAKSANDGLRQLILEAEAEMQALANRTDRMRRALQVLS